MNNYVSCYIQGGLGNQLFQIASVYEYADMYKKTPIFANVDYLPNQFNYERRTYWDTLFSGKLNVIDINEYNKIYFNNLYEQQGFVYNKLPYINDNVKIIGYFQAHRYISEKTRIKMIELIYSNDTYMYNAYNKYNSIKSYFGSVGNIEVDDDDMISFHVRRGDYVLLQNNHPLLDEKYYKEAYDISCKLSNKKRNVVVFSDDIAWCKETFASKYDNIYFVELDNISIEFILMSLFKNNVIANSSFSWFASFISSYKDKIVIAPNKWSGNDGAQNVEDLYLPNMIRI
jgi:hypothetical protein